MLRSTILKGNAGVNGLIFFYHLQNPFIFHLLAVKHICNVGENNCSLISLRIAFSGRILAPTADYVLNLKSIFMPKVPKCNTNFVRVQADQ